MNINAARRLHSRFSPESKIEMSSRLLSGDLAGLLAWPLLNTFPMILLNKINSGMKIQH